MNILQINASIRGSESASSALATAITSRLQAAHPGSTTAVVDLGVHPLPTLDGALLGALFTPADKRSGEQQTLVTRNDTAIAQLQARLPAQAPCPRRSRDAVRPGAARR